MTWITSIFVIVSGLLLFASWGRAYRLKSLAVGPVGKREWQTLQIVVLVALIADLVALITAIWGNAIAVAHIMAITLTITTLCIYVVISYFRAVAGVAPGFGGEFPVSSPLPPEGRENLSIEESLRKITHDMRNSISVVIGMADSLRSEGADSEEDLKDSAGAIADSGRKLNELVEQLQAVCTGPGDQE